MPCLIGFIQLTCCLSLIRASLCFKILVDVYVCVLMLLCFWFVWVVMLLRAWVVLLLFLKWLFWMILEWWIGTRFSFGFALEFFATWVCIDTWSGCLG